MAPSHFLNQCWLSMRPSGTDFNEIWIRILSFSFMKLHLKMSSARMAAILSRGRWVNIQHNDTAVSWGVKWLINSLLYGWLAGEICVGKGCHSANYTLYSVLPIYRGRVYRGIRYIPWTPFVGDIFSRNLLTAVAFDPARRRQFFAKSALGQSGLPVKCGREHMLCDGQQRKMDHWHLHCITE